MSASADIIGQLNVSGFCVIPCPWADLTAEAENILVRLADSASIYGIRASKLDPKYSAADTHPLFVSLWSNATVVELAERYIGEQARIYHAGFNNRIPGQSEAVHWHRDYLTRERRYGRRIEVSWYITRSVKSNGAIRIIPGSHTEEWRDWNEDHERDWSEGHPDETIVEIGPESLLLRDAYVWHATHRNRSGAPRYMYSANYCTLAERRMIVDFELMLPREVVESPTGDQARLYALNDWRDGLFWRNGRPVETVAERLGISRDHISRMTRFYRDGNYVTPPSDADFI